MNYYCRFFVAACLSVVFYSTAFAGMLLQDLQAKLSSFHSMRANFQQALYADKREAPRTSKGKMAIQRPGKFRWIRNHPMNKFW